MYEFTAAQKIYLRIKYTADFFIGLLGLVITAPPSGGDRFADPG